MIDDEAHVDIVRRALDDAFVDRENEREKRESDAFARGMMVGVVAGVIMWVSIALALLAYFGS